MSVCWDFTINIRKKYKDKLIEDEIINFNKLNEIAKENNIQLNKKYNFDLSIRGDYSEYKEIIKIIFSDSNGQDDILEYIEDIGRGIVDTYRDKKTFCRFTDGASDEERYYWYNNGNLIISTIYPDLTKSEWDCKYGVIEEKINLIGLNNKEYDYSKLVKLLIKDIEDDDFYCYRNDKVWKQFRLAEETGLNIPKDLLDDRWFVSKLMKYHKVIDKDISTYIDEKYKNDKSLAMDVVSCTPTAIKYFSREIQDDKDVLIIAARKAVSHFDDFEQVINKKYFEDEDIMLSAISNIKSYSSIKLLDLLSEKLKKDRDLTLKAVSLNGEIIYKLDSKYLNDKEVMLAAVKQNGESLKYIFKKLQNDKEIVLAAVEQNGDSLSYASEELRNDKEIVLAAVKQCGDSLHYASKKLKNDKEIVLIAINNSKERNISYIFELLSKKLQNDKEIVLIALKNMIKYDVYDALESLSKELQNDREIVLAALKNMCEYDVYDFFESLSKELQNDKEIVLIALKNMSDYNVYDAFKSLSKELQNDRKIVLIAIKQNGNLLEYASKELQNDKEIVLIAVKQNGGLLKYASKELQNDREIVLLAVNIFGSSLEYASKKLQNDKEIVLSAVNIFGSSLKYASKELQNDREIVLVAVKQNGYSLMYASKELQNDREIVLEAVKESGYSFEYASDELKKDKEILLIVKRFIDSVNEFISLNKNNYYFSKEQAQENINALSAIINYKGKDS